MQDVELEAYQRIGLLEPEAEAAECWRDEDPWHVYPDTDPWYISADGLAAARLGDGAQVSAPDWGTEAEEPEPPLKSLEEEAEERRRHREEQRKWDTIWMDRAERRDWSYPEVPLEAYRHSGTTEEVTADPRKETKYIEEVQNTRACKRAPQRMKGLPKTT